MVTAIGKVNKLLARRIAETGSKMFFLRCKQRDMSAMLLR